MANNHQRRPSCTQVKTMPIRSGVKFQNEFLGAAITPRQRLRARAPSQERSRADHSMATVSRARPATRASINGSTGRPGYGGRVQVEGIANRLSQPLIDSLLQ